VHIKRSHQFLLIGCHAQSVVHAIEPHTERLLQVVHTPVTVDKRLVEQISSIGTSTLTGHRDTGSHVMDFRTQMQAHTLVSKQMSLPHLKQTMHCSIRQVIDFTFTSEAIAHAHESEERLAVLR
jgi:hypothetical protein